MLNLIAVMNRYVIIDEVVDHDTFYSFRDWLICRNYNYCLHEYCSLGNLDIELVCRDDYYRWFAYGEFKTACEKAGL